MTWLDEVDPAQLMSSRPHDTAEARLLRRFGSDAPAVLTSAVATSGRSEADLLAPVASRMEVTAAELLFGVTHEGVANVADLLERRTRVGLIDL